MNNKVVIVGECVSNWEYSHSHHDVRYYKCFVSVKRDSGTVDVVPVVADEKLIDTCYNYQGERLGIIGVYKSYNDNDKLLLYAYAYNIEITDSADVNDIFLEGTICKPPSYRETPKGRVISDVILAVNRANERSDYIPCVAWGKNACILSYLPVGTKIRLSGRVQSRVYKKNNDTKTAYEVSVSLLEVL